MPVLMFCSNCGRDTRDENVVVETYHYIWSDDESAVDLCHDCAIEEEFCIWCGGFYGGTEEWFRANTKGMCLECQHQYEDQYQWEEEQERWGWFPDEMDEEF